MDNENADVRMGTFAASFLNCIFSLQYKIILSHLVSRGQTAMEATESKPSAGRET